LSAWIDCTPRHAWSSTTTAACFRSIFPLRYSPPTLVVLFTEVLSFSWQDARLSACPPHRSSINHGDTTGRAVLAIWRERLAICSRRHSPESVTLVIALFCKRSRARFCKNPGVQVRHTSAPPNKVRGRASVTPGPSVIVGSSGECYLTLVCPALPYLSASQEGPPACGSDPRPQCRRRIIHQGEEVQGVG